MSQQAVARLLARELSLSPEGAQVDLSRYEAGLREPPPARLAVLLEILGATPEHRCRAAVGAVLTPAVLSAWVDAHGGELVRETLWEYAGVAALGAALGARIDAQRAAKRKAKVTA